jgi:hypothetical protein
VRIGAIGAVAVSGAAERGIHLREREQLEQRRLLLGVGGVGSLGEIDRCRHQRAVAPVLPRAPPPERDLHRCDTAPFVGAEQIEERCGRDRRRGPTGVGSDRERRAERTDALTPGCARTCTHLPRARSDGLRRCDRRRLRVDLVLEALVPVFVGIERAVLVVILDRHADSAQIEARGGRRIDPRRVPSSAIELDQRRPQMLAVVAIEVETLAAGSDRRAPAIDESGHAHAIPAGAAPADARHHHRPARLDPHPPPARIRLPPPAHDAAEMVREAGGEEHWGTLG